MRCGALFLAVLLAVPAEGRGRRSFGGRCDPLKRCQAACQRRQQLTCSSLLSDGPTDADVEIKLTNLPASTANEHVHLHWWAARKSPTEYNPLNGPVGCSVHRDMKAAYPAIYDSDFNGGNVRVSESGAATIRVRAPSTFFVWRYIAIPHINMRLCTGGSSVWRKPPDAAFYFGSNETWLRQRSGKAADIQVASAAPYSARVPSSGLVGGPRPVAVIVAANVRAPQTTTTVATTPMTEATAQVLLDAAKDALSLDALEFSPVYECFLLNKFFDHFSSDCVERCPDGSEVVHGQCARPTTDAPTLNVLSATWKLTIDCSPGQNCWGNQDTTLHRTRLAAAGHLMIPFQELTVTVGFNWAGPARRLLQARELYLTVNAKTQRWTQDAGHRLLRDFVSDHEVVGEMLDVTIRDSQIHSGGGSFSNTKSMSELNDPYSPAYEALSSKLKGTDSSVLSFLPPAAIAGIACGAVVFLASAIVGIICLRRRQQKKAREAVAQGKIANNNKVAEEAPASDVGYI